MVSAVGRVAVARRAHPLLRRPPLWMALASQIRELIRQNPDLTLGELKKELQTDLSVQTLCVALRQLRLTVTKKC